MAYADTDHLFSQPIRTYKANDPYYYEVDNIPIRQLEENVLWAKDQIDSLLVPAPVGAEPQTGSPLFVGDDVDLEHIKQFRPKFAGGRNIIVQGGWFNARVNDAYNVIDSLAQITAAYTGRCSDLPKLTQNETTAFFDAVWASYTTKFTSESFVSCPGESNEALSYRATGLETMYTFYISQNFGEPIDTAVTTSYGAPEYRADGTGRGKTWPALWHTDIYNLSLPLGRTNWSKLNEIHLKIVQHWRGVARTSVVDFRGDSIEIPPFNKYDYFYVEEGSTGDLVTSLDDLATQRVDLLVVYTHPIDASTTTLSEYEGVSPFALPGGVPPRSPKTISTPTLGLIRGAGIGLKRTADDRIELLDRRMYPGEQKILANLNDHTDGASNTGIKLRNGSIIHGSFPSPDDLVNIAPNLTLALEDDNIQLVGQTALPIAYVVVTKDSTNLSQDDIIDIRPFLRTTELAYNERAGIAGAQPALSFANPAVGAAQLEGVTNCLQSQLDSIPGAVTPAAPIISHLSQEYIMGGLAYGPESALLAMNTATDGPMHQSAGGISPAGLGNFVALLPLQQKKYIRGLYYGQEALGGTLPISAWMADVQTGDGEKGSYLGIPQNRVIPLLPEWQAQINNYTNNTDANKWFAGGIRSNSFIRQSTTDANISNGYTYTALFTQRGSGAGDLPLLQVPFYFLQKNIRIILPPNAVNFSVIANYVNSVPHLQRTVPEAAHVLDSGSGHIMISRTGSYADPLTNNQVIDLMILLPYPIQATPTLAGGPHAIPQATGDDGAEEFLCYRVFTAGGNSTGTEGVDLGKAFPPNIPIPGGQGQLSRGQGALPYPRIGFCFYPTVGLTLAFHRNSGVGQMVPAEALTNLVQVGDPTVNQEQWTGRDNAAPYPPTYNYTTIDLS